MAGARTWKGKKNRSCHNGIALKLFSHSVKFFPQPADEFSIKKSVWKDKQREAKTIMTRQEAIRILMLSPFYFRMTLADRKLLVSEFCCLHSPKEQ
ncbi:MAG: hypothetical protein BM485_06350 [Desulfobulbaceae bacterium DB1]|nr:MAG: hypothetical protein BM485_06350 [Desulfobulbaceae bacterium DB1]